MTFREITNVLGIQKYPDKLEHIYQNEDCSLDFSGKVFDSLEEEFGALGTRIDDLKQCAMAVSENPHLAEYTKIAVRFLEKATHPEGYSLALPTLDSDTALYHYPIMLLAFALPSAIKKYRDRGFPDEEIKELLSALKGSICSVDSKTGKPSVSGYHWLRHYTSAVIYNAGLFGVTPRIIDAPVMLLKNKRGEYKIIMTDGRFHSSGKILGSAGCTDEDGAFDAEFSEDDEYYTAHEVISSHVSKNATRLSKREWQTVAKKGDWIVGLHIPRGADLSEEKMTEGFRSAMLKTARLYPDLSPKAVHCSTWLLDPYLAEILGPGSKITGFLNRFIKYPIKSGGKELFGFAFPSTFDSYESLPENSSLQRKLKALYVGGGYIHAYSGFIPESDTWAK